MGAISLQRGYIARAVKNLVAKTLPLSLLTLLVACGKPAGKPSRPTPTPQTSASPQASESPTPAPGAARSLRVTDPTTLPPGPAASGIMGDYLLENEHLTAVVSDLGRGEGFALSGGNLIDLAPRGGIDQLGQVFTWFDAEFPHQAVYTEISPAMDGATALIRVRGRDDRNLVDVVTEYRLAPSARALELRTTVTAAAAQPAFELGDVLQWGMSQHFLPGIGFVFKGTTTLPWVAGISDTTVYGYSAAERGALGGLHGSSWSDVVVATPDLAPGTAVTYRRFMGAAVGGDVASAQRLLASLRGEKLPATRGRVLETGSGRGVAGARVVVTDDAGIVTSTVLTDYTGAFVAPVAAGHFVASAPERGSSAMVVASASVELALPQPGSVRYAITEAGAPTPCKLSIAGIAPTPDPDLGPIYRAAGARTVVLSATGAGTLALPPGRYALTASRGIEYDLVHAELQVDAGGEASFTGALTRVVDTTGYISADLHQHAQPSSDSAVNLDDRVLSDLAEGVELMVGSDHNAITDYAPVITRMGAGARLAWIPGDEATTHSSGHFNAFPMAPDPTLPRGGAPPAENRDPRDIVRDLRAYGGGGDRVVQINHPRAGDVGYFDILKLDPAQPDLPAAMIDDFDALEVMNGKRAADTARTLPDWFMLLGRGRRVTATGNSDSHTIFGQEVGYPRNFIRVERDDPQAVSAPEVVRSLREGRDVVVTNGPFIRVTRAGAPVLGSTVTGKKASLTVEVLAAPWVDVTSLETWRDGKKIATAAIPAGTAVLRLKTAVTLAAAAKPSFIVFVARGTRPLSPVAGTGPDTPTPMAITNPVWLARK